MDDAAVDDARDSSETNNDDPARSAFDALRADPTLAQPEPGADGDAKRPRGWRPGRKRGICQECGKAADGPSATWCAKHRPVKADQQPKPRAGGPGRPPPATSVKALQKELTTQIEMAAMLWAMRDPECASVLLPRDFAMPVVYPDGREAVLHGQGHGAIIAEYWAGRASASPAVHRALAQIVGTTGWLGAITVHAPLLVAVWGHHVEPRLQARREAATEKVDADVVVNNGDADHPAAA